MNQDIANGSERIHTLRTQHGLSMAALARHCSLSIRQIRQIEEGGHDAFYSPAIKQVALRKVLATLQNADASMLTALVAPDCESSLAKRPAAQPFLLKALRAKSPQLFSPHA